MLKSIRSFFSDDYAENFDFLQDCPELIEQLDSFPTNSTIPVEEYYGIICRLAKNVYAKLPDENKGKAVLSYLRNTKSTMSFINLRVAFINGTLPEDYIFSQQDYSTIIEDLDGIIDKQELDSDFFNAILEHSTDEFKYRFTSHLIERARSTLKENNDDKIINFFDLALGTCIREVNFSEFENSDEIINLFINNNMVGALDKSLATSKSEADILSSGRCLIYVPG